MVLVSSPWFDYPLLIREKEHSFCFLRSHCARLRLPSSSSSSSSSSSLLLLSSKPGKLVSRRSSLSSCIRKRGRFVCCSQLKVEDDLDVEACELVNGSEVQIGEGSARINALFFSAVKNNNGAGILLLSDIFGFGDSYNRDFAYRVACNGYNVLVPDLFRGDPWSRDRSQALFEQWLNRQNPTRVAMDIAASTKWMVDEFKAAGSTKKLGIIGFCYGGGRVLDVLAGDQISAFGTGVSFYGTRMDINAARRIKVPVLLVTGDNDPLCPVDILKKVESKIERNSRVVIFEGRGHGFVHSPQSPEEDDDAEKAFTIMKNWLSDQLLNND